MPIHRRNFSFFKGSGPRKSQTTGEAVQGVPDPFKPVLFILFGIIGMLSSCLEDRTFPVPDNPAIKKFRPGVLIFNEIFPSGSAGSAETRDWVEIFNPTDTAIQIDPGSFWVTENKTSFAGYSPEKSYTIPPKGFFLIYFENGGRDTIPGAIVHTGANLSSSGEFLAMFVTNTSGDTILLDSLTFPDAPGPGNSYGSLPDGSKNRSWMSTITKGKSNNENLNLDGEPFAGRLIINELDPNGTDFDWVEIVNPFPKALLLEKDKYFFSDDTSNPGKYALPVDFNFPQNAYQLVECATAGPEATSQQLRAKFGFSGNGESFSISYKKSDGSWITLASVDYPAGIESGKSYGRKPDRTGPFSNGLTPSPGLPNP